MPVATVAFHGSLRFFRPPAPGPAEAELRWEHAPSLKDAVESLGAPHPEVDLILVDGTSRDFGRAVVDGSRIDVFGLDRPPELAAAPGLIPAPPDPRRFVLDGHLGRLARLLRILGFDCRYERHADDEQLALVSSADERILLTRDRGLLKRSVVRLGYLPRSDDVREQLREVAGRYDLAPRVRPFTRCARCNGMLRAVERAAVAERLADEPRTLRFFDTFAECPDCRSIYWRGSHYDRIRRALADILPSGDGPKPDAG